MSSPDTEVLYVVLEVEPLGVRQDDGTLGYLPVYDSLEQAIEAAGDRCRVRQLRRGQVMPIAPELE